MAGKTTLGQSPSPIQLTGSKAQDDESLTVASSAVPLTKAANGYNKATITVESNSIRFWISGHAPTTTSGHLVPAGGTIDLDFPDQIAKFQAISTSGSATLQVTYY